MTFDCSPIVQLFIIIINNYYLSVINEHWSNSSYRSGESPVYPDNVLKIRGRERLCGGLLLLLVMVKSRQVFWLVNVFASGV